MNTKNLRLLLIVSIIALAFGLGTMASQFLPPGFLDNLALSSMFLPIIQRSPDVPDAPSGTLYIFSSDFTTKGDAGGRTIMNKFCSDEDPSAHFCSLYEIETAMAASGVYFQDPFGNSWVDYQYRLGTLVLSPTTGQPVVESQWQGEVENCFSWTDSSNLNYHGKYILRNATDVSETICGSKIAIACCKWIP